MLQWVLLGVFVADSTFFFRILEVHGNEMGCLMGKEAIEIKLGKDKENYGLVCIPTDQLAGNNL